MRIKSVVKVMNFHSLLRVDSSRRNAEKYFRYEQGLTDFTDNILNNRNLILDKKALKRNKNGKPLNIYIGNDLGFCGNFNSNVNEKARGDTESDKIIIGKKIMRDKKNVLLSITKEEYMDNVKKIEDILYDSIKNSKHNEVNVIYNHYYNISKIELLKKRILPLEEHEKSESAEKQDLYKEDFVVEGDINNILIKIIVLYLSYEIRIAKENSFASENIMRQTITRESLKKIDEMETETARVERKIKNIKSFKKVIENYSKLRSLKD